METRGMAVFASASRCASGRGRPARPLVEWALVRSSANSARRDVPRADGTSRPGGRRERVAGGYVVRGQKMLTSRALHSDLMLLLVRTTPLEAVARKTEGLSVLLVELRAPGIVIRPIRTMLNHATTEVFFDGVEVPASALVGEEGK